MPPDRLTRAQGRLCCTSQTPITPLHLADSVVFMSQPALSLYEVLGVDPHASQDDIRLAYRRRVLAVHPDKNPGDAQAGVRFIAINSAYQTLKDSRSRSEYDKRHTVEFEGSTAQSTASSIPLITDTGYEAALARAIEQFNTEMQFGEPTTLRAALEAGDVNASIKLIRLGADVNEKRGFGSYGSLHLHYVACHHKFDLAKLLLDNGAAVNATDSDHCTALHVAMKYERPQDDMVHLLLSARANPNAQNAKGSTPLHFAAAHGHTSHVKLLLGASANANAQNHKGQTALVFAQKYVQKYNHHEAIDLLHSAMQSAGDGLVVHR